MGCHYVPQEYLRGFSDRQVPGEIWMYDKQGRRFMHVPVAVAAQERGFYDAETEQLLSCEVEGRGHAVLNALRTERRIPTPDERLRLAFYITTMMTRVPRNRRRGKELVPAVLDKVVGDVSRVIDRWAAKGADPALVTRRREELEQARVHLREKPTDDVIERILSPWPTQKEVACVYQMTWRVLESTGPQYFLTGDNPACFFEAYGLGRAESEMTFPLCLNLALVGSRQGDPCATIFLTAKQAGVKEVNRRIVAAAERFVYCHERQWWIDAVARKPRPHLSRMMW